MAHRYSQPIEISATASVASTVELLPTFAGQGRATQLYLTALTAEVVTEDAAVTVTVDKKGASTAQVYKFSAKSHGTVNILDALTGGDLDDEGFALGAGNGLEFTIAGGDVEIVFIGSAYQGP